MSATFTWSAYEEHAFDRIAIPQTRLDIAGPRRVNALPWRGQFSPELAELLISEFLPSGRVIDPFCGSGTTLVESALLGRPSSGTEINPAAYILARAYEFVSLDLEQRHRLVTRLTHDVAKLEDAGYTFDQVSRWARNAESYPEQCMRQATFLLAAGNASFIKPARLGTAARQVSMLVLSLPDGDAEVSVSLGDARQLQMPDDSASGLLTSPPYINVFNYHQNYRKAVEALGWGVLSSAKAEFGSNRKHRQNRFLTAIQYAQDITQALQESARVLKPGSTSVWVVGRESRIRGVAMPNPLIVYEAATRGAGLTLISKHERSFTSRYGQRVFEDVLVFGHPLRPSTGPTVSGADIGRDIGTRVLTSVLDGAGEAALEIEAALGGSHKVFPSESPAFTHPPERVPDRAELEVAS